MKSLLIGILFATLGLLLAACGAVVDSEGFKVGDPKRFAEATHVAEMSQIAAQATEQAVSIEATKQTASIRVEATRQAADVEARATAEAIAHQRAQAEADKVRAQATVALSKAKSEVEAQPAQAKGLATAYLVGYVGLGVAVLVLTVGLAFGIVALVNKRAHAIYPNKQGQFPLIPEHGPGWIVYHDPNRALGPGTILHTPGLIERVAYSLALARGKIKPLEPGAEYPQAGSEPAMLQVATQEQMAQVRIAETANRPKLILAVDTNPGQARQGTRSRMPAVTVVNDPKQVEAFEQKLLEAGDE